MYRGDWVWRGDWVAVLFLLVPFGHSTAQETTQPTPAPSTSAPSIATAPATAPAEPTLAGPSIFDLQAQLTNAAEYEDKRKAAVNIVAIGSADAVHSLLSVLSLPNNEKAKQAACRALAESRFKSDLLKPPLIALLDHEDPMLSSAAIDALDAYAEPEIVAKLKDIRVARREAMLIAELQVEAKARYELTPAGKRMALLDKWLQSNVEILRLTALEFVHQIDEPAESTLKLVRALAADGDPRVLEEMLQVLRDLRKPEDAALVRGMIDAGHPGTVRAAIYNALGYLPDDESIRVCAGKGLTDEDPAVATQAATALKLLAGHNPGPTPELRQLAIDALALMAKKEIESPPLREAVIDAMATIADPVFQETLLEHASAGAMAPAIRQIAMRGLSQIGDPSVIPTVIKVLTEDPEPRVRESAAAALGKLGSKADHLGPLRERLSDSSDVVQKQAWQAYLAVFKRLDPTTQEVRVASWTADANAAVRRLELLIEWEKQLVATKADPKLQIKVAEMLGDAFLTAERATEATLAYYRAFSITPVDQPDERAALAGKLVNAYLKASDLTKAITVAVDPKEPQKIRDAAALPIHTHIAALAPAEGLAALDVLKQSVPDLYGEQWAPKFEALRVQFQTPETMPATTTTPG